MKSRTNSEQFNSAWIEERSPQAYGDITRDASGQKQNISTTIKLFIIGAKQILLLSKPLFISKENGGRWMTMLIT